MGWRDIRYSALYILIIITRRYPDPTARSGAQPQVAPLVPVSHTDVRAACMRIAFFLLPGAACPCHV